MANPEKPGTKRPTHLFGGASRDTPDTNGTDPRAPPIDSLPIPPPLPAIMPAAPTEAVGLDPVRKWRLPTKGKVATVLLVGGFAIILDIVKNALGNAIADYWGPGAVVRALGWFVARWSDVATSAGVVWVINHVFADWRLSLAVVITMLTWLHSIRRQNREHAAFMAMIEKLNSRLDKMP